MKNVSSTPFITMTNKRSLEIKTLKLESKLRCVCAAGCVPSPHVARSGRASLGGGEGWVRRRRPSVSA